MLRALVISAAVSLAGACFSPSFNEGVPCGENGSCPGDQSCNPVDNRCYSEGNGPGTIDAAVDGSLADASADASVDPPDANPNAPDSASLFMDCDDLLGSTECGPGEKCSHYVETETSFRDACVPNGTVGTGGACTPANEANPFDDCLAGALCSDGVCKPYCNGTGDCDQPRGQCVVQGANAVVCSSNCDPLSTAPALCPGGWGCTLVTVSYEGTNHPVVECTPAGSGEQGQACTAPSDCAPGYLCATTDGTLFQCSRICAVGGAPCPGPGTCARFTPAHIVGGVEYGACFE